MTKTAAQLLVAALIGAGITATVVKLASGQSAPVVAQSEHTFYTGRMLPKLRPDGGVIDGGFYRELYNRSCGRVLGADAGIVSEPCKEAVLNARETACAEAYFACVVLPRVKAKAAEAP